MESCSKRQLNAEY